jgi:uncharacterized repeat protein (TIGR03803 family)
MLATGLLITAQNYKAGLTTLVNFNNTDGAGGPPAGLLLPDAHGNLFGTTVDGGAHNVGTVFEIEKTASGYASTPTILVTFRDSPDGAYPSGGLIADAHGNLFGTTAWGGANDLGTVFEIEKTASGYASTPTILVSFNGTNGANLAAGLLADAHGNLFGTAVFGGAHNVGTVFEIEKTASGYASTPTILVSFRDSPDGAWPGGGVIADAHGNLFGTTDRGGASNLGTVFEIEKTASGYASPTILVSFNHGANPYAGLLADAHGNLFGTTAYRGKYGHGTVFEIEKTASGYATTPTFLVSFNGTNGANPVGRLLADAHGNLFGTTHRGGANNLGTVFEIEKTASGYSRTPTVLVSFNGTNGANPVGGLLADGHGNLFGTTGGGGANNLGTVFEIERLPAATLAP